MRGGTSKIEVARKSGGDWCPLGKLAEYRRNEVWLLIGFKMRDTLGVVPERVPKVGLRKFLLLVAFHEIVFVFVFVFFVLF